MYAVIELQGKQYRVIPGEYLNVDRLALDEGATFQPTVLLAGDGDDVMVGDEASKVAVTARVDAHLLGPKIRVFVYRPKKSSKKMKGHRSRLSKITITDIGVATTKKATPRAKKADPVTEDVKDGA